MSEPNDSIDGETLAPAAPDAADASAPPPAWNAEASLADRQAFLNQLTEGVMIADAEGRIIFVNDAAKILHGQALLGVGPDKYSTSYHLFTMEGEPYPPDDLPLTRAVRHGEISVDTRWRIRRSDGSEILAIGNARPIYDKQGKHIAAILNIRDDTQRHADEVVLKDLLRTKEMLLHEVNHRVKNSLQLVTALLSLQAARSDQPAVQEGLADAGKRISVIARIHERLYASSQHNAVNIGELLRDLAADNVAAHGPDGHIRLHSDCQDIILAVDQAVPLALCTTEIVTNAMKYAFAGRDSGTIALIVRLVADDRVEIIVTDDGSGLPMGFDANESAGLGMRIVTALVGQLKAKLTVAGATPGASFTIAFDRRQKN